MKAFKAYDIRGEWGTDLNEDIAYRIGYFLPDILDTDTYLVGRDMRLLTPTLIWWDVTCDYRHLPCLMP